MKRGRPLGSKNRPQFKDYVDETEIKKLVKIAKKQAETKPEILKFVLEQVFGKAVQPLGNEIGRVLKVSFDSSFKK